MKITRNLAGQAQILDAWVKVEWFFSEQKPLNHLCYSVRWIRKNLNERSDLPPLSPHLLAHHRPMDQKAHFLSKALNPSPLLLPLPSSSLGFYPPPSRRNATPPPPLAAAVAVGGALLPPLSPARAAMAAGKSSSASKEDQYAALRELYRPHIDSFDYFIDEGLDKMLQSIRPVEITVPNSPTTLRNILPAFFFFYLLLVAYSSVDQFFVC